MLNERLGVTTITKFEKKKHHYVPQHWQRGFSGASGHLFGKVGETIKIVSTKSIMQSDWLYTVFDENWQPFDALEDALSAIEGNDAKLVQRLALKDYVAKSQDHAELCNMLALQASRHPDMLSRGHRLGREFAKVLAGVPSSSSNQFASKLASYGIGEEDAQEFYIALIAKTPGQLEDELAELTALSPQASVLPEQRALLAAPMVSHAIEGLELTLIDSQNPDAFILGDTPLPQDNLSSGFTVPLTKSLAVIAKPTSNPTNTIARRTATEPEIAEVNRTQSQNAAEIVIGPTAEILKKY